MKKIVFVTHGLNIGGAEVIVCNLAREASKRYKTAIIALDQDGPLRSTIEAEKTPIIVINRKPGWRLSNFSSFFSAINKLAPDLIHAHQYTPYVFAVLYKIFYQQNCQLIFTEHGRHFPDQVSLKRKIFNQIFIKFTNQVTAVCEFAKQALLTKELLKTEVKVIYNGITPSATQTNSLREEFNIPSDDLLIGYVGSLRPVKNPALLLTAFAQVKRNFPKASLVFIGAGSLLEQLKEQTTRLQISSAVFFAGNRLQAAEYIPQFDIFVQPSLSEAHSLALLEAFAAKRATIATAVGGAAESITHQQNGLLCASNDAEGLAEAILLLANNPPLRIQLGLAANETFKNRFTSEMMIATYLELYEKLLNERAC